MGKIRASGGEALNDAKGGGRRFALPGTRRVYERDTPFAIGHIALDLTVDLEEKRIEGSAALSIRRIDQQSTELELDAVDFQISEITVAGKKAAFSYDDRVLVIEVPKSLAEADVVVRYSARPKRGLHFLSPDEHVPNRPKQAWSQCQDEDARYFFPCHDKPHLKHTTEMVAHVARGLVCLSNGKLVSKKDVGAHTVYHWKQEQPHPSYLVTLVVGEFAELRPEVETRVPLTYLVPKGREDDGWRCFERTPAMMELFEKRTGVPYAYDQYAQVVVSDFIAGGMENTSATTMYEHILLDERAALDVDMDGLVAHELAHQWFGDLVTCRDFAEGWLNEGWATYMELVWKDEGTEVGAGRDEYDYAVRGELEIYVDEDASRYRRPIVCRDYAQPMDLFDRHLYQKGALVLHMLRRYLGDGPFWTGVKNYLTAHAHGVVETRDLQRALEAASGKSLDRIFDAYVYGSGHPVFEVEVSVDGAVGARTAVVSLRQTQTVDQDTKLYVGPLTVEVSVQGKVSRHQVEVASTEQVFGFEVAERPDYVVVDPDGDLLAVIRTTAPFDLARGQLEKGKSARVRSIAPQLLAKATDEETVRALQRSLLSESEFWGVRAEAATGLGEIRSEEALEALAKAVRVLHPKVRRSVARALGKWKEPKAAALLKPIALGDRSYLVASEAARSLGHTRQTESFDTLVELLSRASWADVIRGGAVDGLAALRDDRGVPHITALTAYGRETNGRRSALLALARLDPSRKTRELLEERLDDRSPVVRITAVRALEVLADVKARGPLEKRLGREDYAAVRRKIREVLRDLRGTRDGEIRSLRDDLAQAKEQTRELKLRLAKVEAKLGLSSGKKTSAAPTSSARKRSGTSAAQSKAGGAKKASKKKR